MIQFLFFILGASIGSFLNVCIYRLPINLSLFTKPSHCPHCKAALQWHELIPVVSFFYLKGNCSHCSSKISLQYPLVEILSGALLLAIVNQEGISMQSAATLLLCYAMFVILFTDWQHLIIPNEVLAIAGIVWLTAQLLRGTSGLISGIVSALVAIAVIVLVTILGNFLFKKQTMGAGDIKLAGILGLYLGWEIFLIVFWIATLLGALWGIFSILILRKPKEAKIPFGSFLAFASIIAIFYRLDIEIFLAQYLYP